MALLVDGETPYTVATDVLGSTHWPYAKLAGGTAGSDEVIPGTTANGLLVDVKRVQGTVTVAGTATVSGPAAEGAAVSGNPVRQGWRADSTVPAPVGDGAVVTPWATTRGALVTGFIPNTPNVLAKVAGATGSLDIFDDLDGQTPITIVAETELPSDSNGLTSGVTNWLYIRFGATAATADNWSMRLVPGGTLDTHDWKDQPTGDVKAWWADQAGVSPTNSIVRRSTWPVA